MFFFLQRGLPTIKATANAFYLYAGLFSCMPARWLASLAIKNKSVESLLR
jgi:hypothetical protein